MITSPLKDLAGLIQPMGLAKRIEEVMGDLGPSEFARACGVSPASVTFWLSGDTKALKAAPVASMEEKFGYRASWIVFGRGPKKVDGAPEVPWELSEDIRKKLVILRDEERRKVENVLRSSLDMPQPTPVNGAPTLLSNGQSPPTVDTAGREDGSGAIEREGSIPGPKRHAVKRNQRPPHKKGRGGT